MLAKFKKFVFGESKPSVAICEVRYNGTVNPRSNSNSKPSTSTQPTLPGTFSTTEIISTIDVSSETNTLPGAFSTTTIITATALTSSPANNTQKRPWFYLNANEAITLTENAKRDFVWSIISGLSVNYRFSHTNNFWSQSFAQQLWASVGVIVTAPFTACAWSKFYNESYKNCLMYTGISGFSALYSLIPWNGFAYLGTEFFKNRGFDSEAAAYLAILFPSPGAIEGILQTLATTLLSYKFNPNFKFNGFAFALGLSPYDYTSGNAWQVVFTAMNGIAHENTGGLIAQATLVTFAVLTSNYLTMKATIALTEQSKKLSACFKKQTKNNIQALQATGSPIHSNSNHRRIMNDSNLQLPAPVSNLQPS